MLVFFHDYDELIIILQYLLVHKLEHRLRVAREFLHSTDDQIADILDIVCRVGAAVGQRPDLIRHDRKSFSGLTGSCRLNGCVQREQIGLARDVKDFPSQLLDLIELIDEESKEDIKLICSYEEDEIGSKMTTNFIEIGKSLTIKQAMRSLIAQAEENDNISTLFVEDDDGTFYGAIDLKDLIVARNYMDLESLITHSFPYVRDHETISDCIERLKDYAEDSIPVLNDRSELIGVITAQDIVEVVDDELGDDYAKLAGMTEEADLEESLVESIKKRLPWLIVLLGLSMCVSTVTSLFEGVISQLAIIVSFQSVILGMSGNVGTQSLAVTIRLLMDENLETRQKVGMIFREMRIGFSNGLILGILSSALIGGYLCLLKGKAPQYAFAISLCAGIALLMAMTISSIVGTSVPMFFKRINIDPAVASGPLITTVNDLIGVVTYYGVAWLLLINFLHLG